jgi:hypothetical protein
MTTRMILLFFASFALNALSATDDGSGYYLGAGGGWSGYRALFVNGDYTIDDDYSGATQTKSYDEQDAGYRFYGGYQFNKIIGIEGAYTDYGTLSSSSYTQEPYSISLSANAGYSFLEGQLRPFGLLGLAYLKTNQSRDLLDEERAAIHAGLGVEYYPTALHGLGFRAALDADFHISNQAAEDDSGNLSLQSFYQHYRLLYAGLQYKF